MAKDAYIPYAPLGELKPFGTDIWIVDGPEIRMDYLPGTAIPFPTRMTIVRLPGDRLWIHSPIEPDENLLARIETLGEPAYLIAPNSLHYWYWPEWAARYPDAQCYAVPGLAAKAKRALPPHDVLGDEPPAEWGGAFDQWLVRGTAVHEAVFHHRASRTLILVDLIENFEPARVKSAFLRLLMKWAGVSDPDGGLAIDLRMTFLPHRKAMADKLLAMIALAPERIVIAHGRPYEKDGAAELRRAFRWLKKVRRAG